MVQSPAGIEARKDTGMRVERNEKLIWNGENGILKNGEVYLVWQIRDGSEGQVFTLKYTDCQIVEPIEWYQVGEPFVLLSEVAA